MALSSTDVFYVRFTGPGRGVEGRRAIKAKENTTRVRPPEKGDVGRGLSFDFKALGRTMSETFSIDEVARLFEITKGRLRYWDRTDFISPTGYDGARRRYTFQDLVCVRSAVTLIEGGVSLQRARKVLMQLSKKLPQAVHPITQLRIRGDAKTIIVSGEEHEFEADTGQLLIDFNVKSIEENIVSKLPARRQAREQKSAYEWYLEGCRLDEDEEMLGRAEEAYHKAIHMDPTLANAYTNLGNLRYRLGAIDDARILYVKAIEVDEEQPEAHYNLGFIEFDDGDMEQAKKCFSRAVVLDPTFADAHFNLAMTLFRLDEEVEAREHWRLYLNIEPIGPWADIARRRLQDAQ